MASSQEMENSLQHNMDEPNVIFSKFTETWEVAFILCYQHEHWQWSSITSEYVFICNMFNMAPMDIEL